MINEKLKNLYVNMCLQIFDQIGTSNYDKNLEFYWTAAVRRLCLKKIHHFWKKNLKLSFVQNRLKNDGTRYLESYFNFEDFF